jgi:hypothetical protein
MRPFSLPLAVGVLAAFVSTSGSVSFAEDFSILIRRVPATANAMMLVDAKALFASEAAKSGGWQTDREARFEAGLTSVPPRADKLIIASQLDLAYMRPIWECALVESKNPTLISTVARKFGGVLDKIVGMPAVRLPDNAFIVELSENLRGGMTPANRQQVSRWVGLANHNLSPYLTEAARYTDKTAQVIFVLDVDGALTADEIDHRMGENWDVYGDIVESSPVKPMELSELLASMKGIMLGIAFTDRAYGSIKLDFHKDVSKLAPIAKPLLLAVLTHRGAMLEDFNDWAISVNGKQIILKGKLGASGVMRLASMVELPTQAMAIELAQQNSTQQNSQNDSPPTMVEATLHYYHRTESLLKNLRGKKGEAKSIGTFGLWFENYARHVERLPLLNVDPEMLDYGKWLAGNLRDASMAVKGIGIQKRPAQQQAAYDAGGGSIDFSRSYGGYGYAWGGGTDFSAWGTGATYVASRAAGSSTSAAAFAAAKGQAREQQAARVRVRTQLKAKGAATVQEILGQIQTGQAQIRRDMTEKYKVEF